MTLEKLIQSSQQSAWIVTMIKGSNKAWTFMKYDINLWYQ